MKKLIEIFLFSFFVTLAMVVLDALFHLGEGTAVHLTYAAVKFTLIFLILFLVSLWVGKGFTDGLFVCCVGPVIFYLYYLFADPTLNRSIFHLDDSFAYIFLHLFVFAVAYAVMYVFIYQRKGSSEIRNAAQAVIFTLSVFGFDALYQMAAVHFRTFNEELVVKALHFNTSMYLVFSLLLLSFLCFQYLSSKHLRGLFCILVSVLFTYLIGQELIRAIFGILFAGISYYLLDYYVASVGGIKHEQKK